MKRRVIRGSSVFRPATEDDIDEYLEVERHREMVSCPTTAVDIPPNSPDARLNRFNTTPCATHPDVYPTYRSPIPEGAKPSPRRAVRRMPSILTRRFARDGDNQPPNVIDVSEMAAMDEYKAVAVFLREVRRCRKDMFFNLQDKPHDRFVDKAQSNSPSSRRKDLRSSGPLARTAQIIATNHRSLSADDPDAMRVLSRHDRLYFSQSTSRTDNIPAISGDPQYSHDTYGPAFSHSLQRAQSDGLQHLDDNAAPKIHDENERANRMRIDPYTPERAVRSTLQMTTDLPRAFSPSRMERPQFLPPMGNLSPTPTATSSRKTSASACDEDDATRNPCRILTAIEPMDPSLGSDGADARRGTSYHTGTDNGRETSRLDFLRPRPRGDAGLLKRLRSFRKRVDAI